MARLKIVARRGSASGVAEQGRLTKAVPCSAQFQKELCLCSVQLPPGALTLELHHAAVEAAALHQLRRSSLLVYMAVFQHHDVVRPGHGTHPVGDDQHCLAGQQAGEGTLHLGHIQAGRLAMALMVRIQSNYRFVIGFNGGLIALGALGILAPATSAILHNLSTLAISLQSMTNLLPPEKT